MRLTVLGSGAACPPAGGASSGYLVEDRGISVLLDCGHGIAAALLTERPDADIDHIIISHMHADHFIDVIALRFRFSRDMAGLPQPALQLHLPPGGREVMAKVLDAVCFPPDFLDNTFTVAEYGPDAPVDLGGGLRARFALGVHYVPGWSMRLDGDSSLVYTGDTAPSDAVADLARGADLLLAEATLSEPECGEVRGHLTPAQAAELAREAQVGQLILTHFWFDGDRHEACVAAGTIFDGPVLSAFDGLRISC